MAYLLPGHSGLCLKTYLAALAKCNKDGGLCGPFPVPHTQRYSIRQAVIENAWLTNRHLGEPFLQSPLLFSANSSMGEGKMQQQKVRSDSRKDLPLGSHPSKFW